MKAPEFIAARDTVRIESLRNIPGLLQTDRLDLQIFDYLEAAHPDRKKAEIERLAASERERFASLSGWVYYPWSHSLVRILPEAEFHEVRTSRNRHKISTAEQGKMRDACLAIAGLSAGFSVAVNFALESLGRYFILADPDELSLANTNRLTTKLSELGLNKAELAARRMWELNPYLQIEIRTEGAILNQLDQFFAATFRDGTTRRADLVIEECDSLEIKLGIRHEARRRGIPVVMDTTERGMLDVERFDLEPDRPVLHGLAGDLNVAEVRGLSTADKIPYLLDIIEIDRVSARKKLSLVETESTVTGFSQLGSDTTMGGAIAASAARRIIVGLPCPSGRYNVDLDEHLRHGRFRQAVVAQAKPAKAAPMPPDPPPTLTPESRPRDVVSYLLAAAARAPSGANCQPWKFSWNGEGELTVEVSEARARSWLDPSQTAALLAVGAAIENLGQAAACLGVGVRETAFDAPAMRARFRLDLPARLQSADIARAGAHPLWVRACQRGLENRGPLSGTELSELLAGLEGDGVSTQTVAEPSALVALSDVIGQLEGERFLDERFYAEMMSELRWSPDEAPRRTGIGTWTLGLKDGEVRALRLFKDPELINEARKLGLTRGLGKRARDSIRSASAVVIFNARAGDRRAAFEAGRRFEKVWLNLTARGFSAQPVTAGLYLRELARSRPEFYAPDQRERLARLGAELEKQLRRPEGTQPLMLLRVTRARPPAAESPRLELKDFAEGVSG